MTNEQVGFFKKALLILITKMQEMYIDNNFMYYKLIKLHYKVYFGTDIVSDMMLNTENFRRAKKRHVNMVIKSYIKKHMISKESDKYFETRVANVFEKNLLLEAELEG